MQAQLFAQLRDALKLPKSECATLLGVDPATITAWETGGATIPDDAAQRFAQLDGRVETAVLAEVDAYTLRPERDIVLIRFISDHDFALYEPGLFEDLGTATLHAVVVERAKASIERLGGAVTVAFMNSDFYETWLGVNDFDDNRELRIAWARQQLRGL